jgi:outer membrane lipoprotein-sorting protein
VRRAALVAALLLPAAAQGGEADAVLRSLEARGRELRTMRAEFVQVKLSAVLGDKEETRGTVSLRVPGRLRWDYTAPDPSAMLIRDGRFERYFPRTKQVFRGPAKGEADLLVGFGPGAADLGRRYEVALVGEEPVGAEPAYRLRLKPREPGLFALIELWVEKARSIPLQTRLTEPTDDTTTIRFAGVALNTTLPPDAFELRLPSDVIEVK